MNEKSYINIIKLPDTTFLSRIGNFIQTHRVRQNKSQDTVAKEAAISRSTLSLLERGKKTNIDTLIRVLRVLELLYVLDIFNVSEEISPIAYSKLKVKKRKKAYNSKSLLSQNEDLGW
jgi:transcriptional regulator with XRE-family HTH domain